MSVFICHYSRIPTATNVALTETVDGATVLSVSHSAVTNTATIDAYRREMVRTDASMGTPWTSLSAKRRMNYILPSIRGN